MGGLGPLATVEFMRHLVELTAAAPTRLLVDCDATLPDVSRSIMGSGPSCTARLVEMAQGLERGGAEIIVLACNAAHHYEDRIRAALAVPFISMIESACAKIPEEVPNLQRVGLLAAESCLISGVYQKQLAKNGMQAVLLSPEHFARFDLTLSAIRAGNLGVESRAEVFEAINLLAAAGAQAVILGCTEISLVMASADAPVYAVDPGRALAEAAVRYALKSSDEVRPCM